MLAELFLGKQSLTCTDDTIDIIRLIRSENVGPKTFLSLIKFFGTATAALENVAEFSLRGGKLKPIKVFSRSDATKELELLSKNDAKIITYKDFGYSKLLLEIPDFPPVLSYKGNIELLNYRKSIAIVGARNASLNGRSFATKITKELIDQEYIIASGLARGIDTAVHKVDTYKTIAVIAGGIDHIYPLENASLYEQITNNGLIIAELPVGTKPLGQHFPQRNRLISGLSLGTVVVEAGLRSGSLITARMALEQNREVFAVPGFPLDPRCQGANKLIKEGAHLVESVEDIISNLPNYDSLKKYLEDSANSANNFKPLSFRYSNQINDTMRKEVVSMLSSTPTCFDKLSSETDMSLQALYTIILELELAGNLIRYPGNKICLVYK